MLFLFLIISLISTINASVICYQCYANSTETGKYCSIDKLCTGTSCYFEVKNDGSWSAGCSTSLSVNANVTCSTSKSSSSCSCNTDFCNSIKKSEVAIKKSIEGSKSSWLIFSGPRSTNITLTMPDRSFISCEECGTVTVNNETVKIPCDHDHTCQGNYCVSVRGQSPYSYCGGVWDQEKEPACYMKDREPEMCICSNHMCNYLLEPAPIYTTIAPDTNPTLATQPPISDEEPNGPVIVVETDKPTTTTTTQTPTTAATTTKKKCKNGKFSPNDQAVFMGEKLKDAILSGFGGGDNGGIDNFENDINDHICNYSDDDEE